MDNVGQHLLVEYHGCDATTLNDLAQIERLMVEAAQASGATVVAQAFHRFSPQGVSGVVLIAESHMSVHTWPEHGYAAVDFYTCGDCVPERAHEVLRARLGADRSELLKIRRGTYPPGPSMKPAEHYREGREHADADFVPEQIEQR